MSSKNKKILLSFVVLLVVVSFCVYLTFRYGKMNVVVNGREYSVLVARNNNQLTRGLSGVVSMKGNEGMLFDFKDSMKYGFWMKEMNFPLDIIWISDGYKIVYIEKSVATSTYPKIFYPNEPAKYVLEINSGESDKFNFKIGDEVRFLKK